MSVLNKTEQGIIENIEKHGWFCMNVFDPEGEAPCFAYSIGFTKTLAAPEFIIFGLDSKLMHSMLWNIFRQIKSGAAVETDKIWEDLLEGYDCVGRLAKSSDLYSKYVCSSDWFWRRQGYDGHPPVHQIIWPGAKKGLFPWEEGCDDYVILQQPQLWSSK